MVPSDSSCRMIHHPLHRLSTSPRPQAQCLHAFLSPCSSRDQMAGDDAGAPTLVKPEEHSEVRFQNNVWGSSIGPFLPSPSSSSVIQTVSPDGDECSGMVWMSSKMRFMQKTTLDHGPDHCGGSTTPMSKMMRDVICSKDRAAKTTTGGSSGGNHMARACSDCNTTTTPLWRSGPRGPKSLCNACGIRQRKARRAMEEEAAAAGGFDPSTSVTSRINGSSKVHNKEKKSRGAGDSLLGPTCKKTTKAGGSDGLFGDFSALCGAFPRDVTEAAILLMDLSCGFAHT
ncbi:hypothetical protein MLD38_014683 [Melastoma candidum]|uniref:Uncharacterized protein n=1 Tax=Melastoma candidum TaxID=119954 RepID=A0ACB9RHA1_9MYRT|nr:hypothetical protein MLD38_014683 [Melastoma candidum]